ncbi:hypothetical protein [Methylobacterium sp. CM6247]
MPAAKDQDRPVPAPPPPRETPSREFVKAVLRAFPGSYIVDVRDKRDG